jgi:flavin-dependent dehydrogenase
VTAATLMTMSYDVLIVGAGPTGLATALSATRHGARVLVVERPPTPPPTREPSG